ncbi:MAG: transglutaminaseTgpA domain-containing protein [Christensenellales bacterium]|jgi:NADH:ubiquinone oxidoreductase subunit 6 (subunit J)
MTDGARIFEKLKGWPIFGRVDKTALLTWGMDFIAAVLLSQAMTLIAFELLAFDIAFGHGLLVVLCAMAIVLICSRRWWVLPALVGAMLVVSALVFLQGELFESIIEYITGFFYWLGAGMPALEPYSYDGSIFAVELMAALPICAAIYTYMRKFFSFTALCILALSSSIALFYLDMESFEPALLLMLASAIICLPRLVNRLVNKGRPEEERISRASMQIIALPVAALCILLAMAIVPKGEVVWKNETLNTIISDFQDLYDYYFRDEGGGVGSGFSIGDSGFMPLSNRLGGDISLNNNRVMRVETDKPAYLAGSVMDTYDGRNWYDGWQNGRFRYGSIIWRAKRIEAFGLNLPLGGRAAENIFRQMVTEINYEVSPGIRNMRAFMAAGSVKDLGFLYSESDARVYFNLQGELTRAGYGVINSRYAVTAELIDRNLPNFDSNMKRLEEIAYSREDQHLSQILTRYTWLPEGLPESVREAAHEIAGDIDSPYEKAVALESWLSENFSYTTTPGTPPEDRDFVDYFLETKEGYCTYFASAMAVMGRTLGLPTRYVTGYGLRMTEGSNARAGSYEALNSSAHAWCEVYFSGIGWVIFDPIDWDYSPVQEAPRVPVATESAVDSLLEDEFDEEEQAADWLTDYGGAGQGAAPKAFDMRIVYIGAGLLAAAAALWLLIRFEMNRFFRRYTIRYVTGKIPSMEKRVDYYYADIIKQLSFWAVTVQPGDTIHSFCKKADRYVKLSFYSMEEVGRIVMRQRYGEKAATLEELRKMQFYHETLETSLKELLGPVSYFVQRIILRAF